MKHLFILPFIAMLIVFNVGCSLLVNNQEKATNTTVESQEIQKNETTEAKNHLDVAKQDLSSGNYNKMCIRDSYKVIVVTQDCDHQVIRDMHMTPASTLDEALSIARGIMGEDASITIIPNGSTVIVE